MRERVELLLGRSHARDVGDDVPRRLRADAARRGAAAGLHAPVHDLRPGRRAPAGQALPRRARRRHQALHARRGPPPDLRREEQAARRRGLPPARRLVLRADRRRRLRALRARAAPHERDGLRRPARPRGQRARAVPGGPRPLRAAFRHVLVDEYQDTNPPSTAAAAARRRAPQPRGGRRRRAVDLRLPRRRHPQHPRLRGRLPGRDGRQARAELPLDADDPRARPTRSSRTTASRSPSRCGPTSATATRSRSASSTTSTPRRATSSARSSGSSTRARRARRSRSSTGRTRSRGCSRTRSCGARSATRSSAARSSTSAPRSRTRSPT